MGGHVPFGFGCAIANLSSTRPRPRLSATSSQLLQVGSATMLVQELNAAGHRTKRGKPFDKTVIYKLLNNPTYVGEVAHRRVVYRGEQEALVDRVTWDKVHAVLAENCHRRGSHTRALAGAAQGPDLRARRSGHDAQPHAKRGKLYRFYRTATSLKLCHGECPIRAVPAGEVEAAVVSQVRALLRAPELVVRTWRTPGWRTRRSTNAT